MPYQTLVADGTARLMITEQKVIVKTLMPFSVAAASDVKSAVIRGCGEIYLRKDSLDLLKIRGWSRVGEVSKSIESECSHKRGRRRADLVLICKKIQACEFVAR